MQLFRSVSVGILVLGSLSLASPAHGQVHKQPQFIPESIGEFASAYENHTHHALDSKHGDTTKYHAFRYTWNQPSTVVIARRVWIDADSKLHILGEPGTSMKGGGAGAPGVLHVLLPVAVQPPR